MDSIVKQEITEARALPPPPSDAAVIELSSSDSDSEAEEGGGAEQSRVPRAETDVGGGSSKKRRVEALPLGFLDPLPAAEPPLLILAPPSVAPTKGFKQFWKAGDYDEGRGVDSTPLSGLPMDHVRVHPKFLHSNATSHKWALGALAELLDNSLDEVCYGATYVNIDMLENKKDGTRMLLVEDNGGGMDPDKMRQCLSFGYSVKSKMATTIGQYGNGFKTSTMRLGADVIVFSRSRGKEGRRPTQSIGMLSYTFLRSTGKEDIVVPMLDYEKGQVWNRMNQKITDWNTNLETIVKWSPYSSEADLLHECSLIKDQGTRIVIYNLWEDDQGQLELDFDADKHDIQIRGVNRDERKIQMSKQFPNSRHFLTYRHSLRSYASILYLRIPPVFRMILRGKEIEHHNIVNDMMFKQEVTYKPQSSDGSPKDPDVMMFLFVLFSLLQSKDLYCNTFLFYFLLCQMVAVVTIGFVKDAKHHIDIQGFNVYHKNRLIKPFWRVWTAAGSGGRGVIGVLEANFVEPAHDKQDFERTTILSRLEVRLVQMQKTYWSTNSHRVGYAPGYVPSRNKKDIESEVRESSDEATRQPLSYRSGKDVSPSSISFVGKSKGSGKVHHVDKSSGSNQKNSKTSMSHIESSKSGSKKSGKLSSSTVTNIQRDENFDKVLRSKRLRLSEPSYASEESDPEFVCTPSERLSSRSLMISPPQRSIEKGSNCSPLSSEVRSLERRVEGNRAANGGIGIERIATRSSSKEAKATSNGNGLAFEESESRIKKLEDENAALKEKISKIEESISEELQHERDRNKALAEQLEEAQKKVEQANNEQEALIDIFSEERSRRDREEENLRKKLKDASATIQELLEKLSASRNNHRP
ncbi:protein MICRORCHIDIA 7-like isoform X2 [Typha angustifolia]|uniref:protein MICRORCHIDIA 7-like isoform X2 n=1 Tax=Typha angustifolia TaxID=59011 RepID=UPI003C2FD7E5